MTCTHAPGSSHSSVLSPNTFATTFFLLRYDTAGALDTMFDGDGKLVIHGPASDVAVQSDGKIVLGGAVRVDLGGPLSADFAVARLNSDGTPDMWFSDDGLATADFGGNWDAAAAIAVQAYGMIVLAGGTGLHSNSNNFAVARFDSDASFNGEEEDGDAKRKRLRACPLQAWRTARPDV